MYTQLPTGHPSSIPSSVPSSDPSSIPTSQPSSCPSALPTETPSSLPTLCPSSSPSSIPSSQPSAQPSSFPSGEPSAEPTCIPTAIPSAIPTIDFHNAYTASINNWQALDIRRNRTNRVFTAVINSPDDAAKANQLWQNFVTIFLKTPFILDYFQIDVLTRGVRPTDHEEFNVFSSCTDSAKSNNIFDLITLSSSNRREEQCSGINTVASLDSLCWNCTLQRSPRCSDPAHGIVSLPENTACTSGMGKITKFSVAILFYNRDYAYISVPTIVAMSLTPTTYSIVVKASILSTYAGGTLYCRPYQTSTYKLSSVTGSFIKTGGFSTPIPIARDDVLQITLPLTDLVAARNYSVYCYVEDAFGNGATRSDVLASKKLMSTSCCRNIALTSSPSTVVKQSAESYVFRYSISAYPVASSLVVTPLFYRGGTIVTNIVATPSSHTFTNSNRNLGSSRSFTVSVTNSAALGDYSMVLSLSGSAANKYAEPKPQTFKVVEMASPVTVPVLASAQFADSGGLVTTCFNKATDYAKSVLGTSSASTWPCSSIFTFTGSLYTTCAWTSDRCVRMTFCGSNVCSGVADRSVLTLLEPGENVTLKSGVVKASCGSNCASTVYAQSHSISVQTPTLPLEPVVFLSTFKTASDCDISLVIDPSATFGSGGRIWKSTSWSVQSSANSDVSAMLQVLNSYSISSPIFIPYELFQSGIYTFTLFVSNFFGLSAFASVDVDIVVGNISPSLFVSFDGPSFRSTYRYEEFVVSATAALPKCSSSTKVVYSWSVYKDTLLQSAIVSTSINHRVMKVLPYTLEAGATYYFYVTAVTENGETGSALMEVPVMRGGNFVSIRGADRLVIPAGSVLELDATDSLQEDVRPDLPNSVILSWSCIITFVSSSLVNSTYFGSDCSGLIEIDNYESLSSAVLVPIATSRMQIGLHYTFRASAIGSENDVVESASVTVSIANEESDIPSVVIDSSFNKFLTSQILRVGGSISQINVPLVANWSLYDDSGYQLSLAGIAKTPVSKRISTSGSTYSYPLSALPNSFLSGRTYVFRLSAFPQSGPWFETYAEFVVTANGPPYSGGLYISPSAGQSMDTVFTLNAPYWVDDVEDYPLIYNFRFALQSSTSSSMATQFALGLPSQRSYVNSILPAGVDNSTGYVYCSVIVSDFFGASSKETKNAIVRGTDTSTTNFTRVNETISAALNSGDSEALIQAVSVVSSSMGVSDCSAAPDCASLHRRNCDRTPHTCSECLAGFSGIEGDSNVACYSDTTLLSIDGEFCSHQRDCGSLFCVDGVCRSLNKTCPSTTSSVCSGGGRCIFVDKANGSPLGECPADNEYCMAECRCDQGLFGSACSLSYDEYSNRAMSRESLCRGLENIISSVDLSIELLSYVTSALRQTFRADETLTVESLNACLNVLQSLTDICDAGYVVNDDILIADGASSPQQNIMETVSEFLKFVQRSADSSIVFTTSSQEEVVAGIILRINNMIESLVARISSDMVGGEETIIIMADGVHLTVSFLDQNDMSGIMLQATDSGSSDSPSMIMPTSGMRACSGIGGGGDYMRLSMLEWQQNPYSSPGNETSSGLLMSRILRFTSIGDASTTSGDSSDQYNTTYDLVLRYTAPQNWSAVEPECATYDTNGMQLPCPCKTISYDEYMVKFRCTNLIDLCPSASSGRRRVLSMNNGVDLDSPVQRHNMANRRRLDFDYQGEADDDDARTSDITEYGALVMSLKRELVSTLGSPGSFNVKDAVPVLGCLGAALILFFIGGFLFSRWDEKDYNYMRYVQAHLNREASKDSSQRLALGKAFLPSRRGVYDSTSHSKAGIVSEVYDAVSGKTVTTSPVVAEPVVQPVLKSATQVVRTEKEGRTREVPERWALQLDEEDSGDENAKAVAKSYKMGKSDTKAISTFFDNALPPSSLLESKSGWIRFWHAILREHNWIRCFTYPSLRFPRLIRYLTICSELMIILFVDSLFYGILFTDNGECEALSGKYGYTEEDCLALPSKLQSSVSRCMWSNKDSVCELRPPPSSIQFYMVVSIMITIVTVIPNVICAILLSDICTLRPKWTTDKEDDDDEHPHVVTRKSELGEFLKKGQSNVGDAEPFNEQFEIHKYIEFLRVEEEANLLLTNAEKAFKDSLMYCTLPWRVENLSQTRNFGSVDHARTFIGVYPDGTPIPLTWMQWLSFGTPRKRIERKLKRVRERAKAIMEDMEMFVEGEEDCKDTLLIQNFILEQLSPFKRYALRHEFFQMDTAIPGFVNGWVWLSAWAFIISTWMFLAYWVVMWAIDNSGISVQAWAYQLIFVVLQEIFINELLQIFIVNVIVIEALRPQLRRIYFALNTVIISKMADLKTTDKMQGHRENVRVVQHMSAACRAARKNPDLPASQLLMRVDDNDAALCQNNRDISLGWLMSMLIAIPTLLALSHESVQQGVMDVIFPTLWCCFLLGNAYLYSISPGLVVIPYCLLVLLLLYRYCIQLPRRHRNVKRLQGIEHEEEGPNKVDITWKNMNLSIELAGEKKPSSGVDAFSRISRSLSTRGRDDRFSKRFSTRNSLASSTVDTVDSIFSGSYDDSSDSGVSAEDADTFNGEIRSDKFVAVTEMPLEISEMKVYSKKRDKFAHRERHNKKKAAKLVNKYVWRAGKRMSGGEHENSLDIRPLDERINSSSPARRLSVRALSSMMSGPATPPRQHTKQAEALQGLGELRRVSSMQKRSLPVVNEHSTRHSLRDFTSSLGDYMHDEARLSEDESNVDLAVQLDSDKSSEDFPSESDTSDER